MVRIMGHILKGYALWVWYWIYKPFRDLKKAEAKRKIEICEKCEHFEQRLRICNLCGCFMDIKTKSARNEECFDERW